MLFQGNSEGQFQGFQEIQIFEKYFDYFLVLLIIFTFFFTMKQFKILCVSFRNVDIKRTILKKENSASVKYDYLLS